MTDPQWPGDEVAARYASAVRDELADLPPGELAEIMDEVRDHLAHVVAEFGDQATDEALIDRLGPPATYARELRAGAGMAEPAPPVPTSQLVEQPGFFRRLGRFTAAVFGWAAVAFAIATVLDALFVTHGSPALVGAATVSAVAAAACTGLLVAGRDPATELREIPGVGVAVRGYEKIRSEPWGGSAIGFVQSLGPAWWVLRAVIFGVLVARVTTVAMGAVAFLAALVPSVVLGLRTASGQIADGGRRAVYATNAALVVGGAAVSIGLVAETRMPAVDYVSYDAEGAEYDEGYHVGYNDAQRELNDGYGEVVEEGGDVYVDHGVDTAEGLAGTNIFVYGPDGALLRDVMLFDEDGRPIELGTPGACVDGAVPGETFTVPNPWGGHVYPRLTVEVGESGVCGEPRLDAPYGAQLP
ncbi:HAAS signaling domain-containing protein [Phytoactinopolyspora halotolerans]|uniref:Uncharacterized protein n=1 Tax=Phytoactinopolyspora halotolerans TaxID=1981512 RepID=A0A6L9S6T3_9ACTN|nr:hypothetical protein [Phytoactinopolyspora halotolerans]NED99699.1 hypothetical protein [Phytoactinopolyspora halotolerans]